MFHHFCQNHQIPTCDAAAAQQPASTAKTAARETAAKRSARELAAQWACRTSKKTLGLIRFDGLPMGFSMVLPWKLWKTEENENSTIKIWDFSQSLENWDQRSSLCPPGTPIHIRTALWLQL